jgi:hypothetical protein
VRVNGVLRRSWQFRGVDQGRRIDVTDWFDNGTNTVEFEAENFGGPGDYGVELWVNDTLVVNERCPESVCVPGGDAPAGTLMRRGYTFAAEGLERALPAKVELRVSNVDDFAYATVNGVRRGEWRLGMPPERIDVTSWFMNGRNDVRLQALNGGGPAGARFELWVDGRLVVNEGCSEGVCPPGADARTGIVFDKSYSIDVSGVRNGRELDLTSAVPGKLYVDNVYTGLTTPAQLTLPPGSYTLGLGVSTDTPGQSSNRFHEEVVRIGRCAKQVDLSRAPTVAANPWRLLVLPVRYTEHGGPADTGVLADTDVTLMTGQAIATSSAWVEPFTYGLQTWDVTTHAVVEDTVLHREAPAGAAPDTGRFLRDAGLEHLESEFDSIVFIYSVHREDGASVENTPCCAWAGGSNVSMNTGWVRGSSANSPNEGLLHEVLHTQESYQSWMQYGLWNGLDGLHGAEEHGYRAEDEAGGEGWRRWYRTFMRGQVAETRDMSSGVDFPHVSTRADLWTGIFYTTRYGRDGVVGGYPLDP